MVCALNPKLSLPAAGMPSSSAIGSFRSPALSILLVAAVQSAYVTPKLNAGALKQARHIQLTNHGLGVDLKRIARAALAAGANGIVLETHPNPEKAISDASSQIPLSELSTLIRSLLRVWRSVK